MMTDYINTVLESLKEDDLNSPELKEFLERELIKCWEEAEKQTKARFRSEAGKEKIGARIASIDLTGAFV